MGCTASVKKSESNQQKSVKALKAAILIQTWFRRHQARLEARRRCSWKIFQALEYSGEIDHVKLCKFFNELLSKQTASSPTCTVENESVFYKVQNITSEERLLDIYADPVEIEIDENYSGLEIHFPLELDNVLDLVRYFQQGKTLHVKYALHILHETRNKLRDFPNVRKTTTSITNQITICGDLHGSFDDLLIIFEKNSAPSCDNPYIFNGDLVDRGPCSVEIVLVIFAFFLLYPNHVFINRGNHEDHIMNSRYGFSKEVIKKYKSHASKIIRVIEDVFSWLTLATVVDNEILVVHGGVSDITDLEYIDKINRHKYTSVLKPDFVETNRDNIDYDEWRQVLDLLWSDPQLKPGCTVNSYRGGGCYFGPDVTKKVLERHGLKLIVRSHECCIEGHDSTHNDKVLTVFSASNYYERGSNKGAYMKILPNLKPYFVEYTGLQRVKEFNFVERISRVEESALHEFRKLIFSHKDSLRQGFRKCDTQHSGLITILEWSDVMERVLELKLPWSMIRKQIYVAMKDGKVDYESCLNQYQIEAMFSKKGNLIEALYRHRNTFETIFRVMDKTNSGMVSLQEFQECCHILCQHTKCMSEQDIQDVGRTLDINQDGFIDFNEFLEAFRLSENTSKIS